MPMVFGVVIKVLVPVPGTGTDSKFGIGKKDGSINNTDCTGSSNTKMRRHITRPLDCSTERTHGRRSIFSIARGMKGPGLAMELIFLVMLLNSGAKIEHCCTKSLFDCFCSHLFFAFKLICGQSLGVASQHQTHEEMSMHKFFPNR